MSETKLLPCHRKGEHCACFEEGKQCCECGWSLPITPDPRIAAADAMAKALKEAAESLNTIATQAGKDEYLKDADQIRGYANSRATVTRAALAAYNATRPLTGQEEDRGQE